jgi:HAD superfamily hydrolase (TIGR01450 family)
VGERLVDAYDLVIFDLDGVVYLVDKPIPGAVEAIAELHRERRSVAYATNNASRRPAEVAALLSGMGVPAIAAEVLTSARASAAVLAERFPAGAPILVVGAEALRAEVRDAGLTVVASAHDAPVAVVQGYGPQVAWADLAEACVAVRAGAQWVATNTDRTLPTARGPLPGNGSLVAALATALDRQPDVVVGKPEPGLFATAARQAGASRALVVGDRLDTDIEGAVRAGMDSLLVLTGVSRPGDLLATPAAQRPTYLAPDLSGLFAAQEAVRVPDDGSDGEAAAGGWRVTSDGARLVLVGSGEPVAALRALCRAAWAGAGGGVVPGSPEAAAALRDLGL